MKKNGFTILELIVIIAIFVTLLVVAIPGFSRWLPNYRLRAATRDLFSNLQHAKLTAVKRHRTCAISFNQDIGGTIYDYVVYVDMGNDLEFSAGDEVLTKVLFSERYTGVSFDTSQGGGDGIDDAIIVNDDGNPAIGFLSNGFSVDNNGDPVAGSIFLTNVTGRQRQVAVSSAGNITII
jgi:type II secretory pathway pseudopilin PulG